MSSSDPDVELLRTDARNPPGPRASRLNDVADRAVNQLVRAYFTKSSLLIHAILYALFWQLEGGDHHTFLDGISIEAVFVALLVGISTKQIIDHHHGVREALESVLRHLRGRRL